MKFKYRKWPEWMEWVARRVFHRSLPYRVKTKVDRYDIWDMRLPVASMVTPLLEQLKEKGVSYFYLDQEDLPEFLRVVDFDPDEDEGHGDAAVAQHTWALDEMIFAFSNFDFRFDEKEWDDEFHHGVVDLDMQFTDIDVDPDIAEKGLKELHIVEGPNHTHWYDEKGAMEKWNRIQHGTYLFGKYFTSLWD